MTSKIDRVCRGWNHRPHEAQEGCRLPIADNEPCDLIALGNEPWDVSLAHRACLAAVTTPGFLGTAPPKRTPLEWDAHCAQRAAELTERRGPPEASTRKDAPMAFRGAPKGMGADDEEEGEGLDREP